MIGENYKPILLVEDDRVDAMTVKRAFRNLGITNPLTIKENGEEALTFLSDDRENKPFIILLDLNMPRMNGIEFLRAIKADRALKKIPVIVLTTSKDEEDKLESYNLGVAGYLVKRVEYTEFLKTIETFEKYWSICQLP